MTGNLLVLGNRKERAASIYYEAPNNPMRCVVNCNFSDSGALAFDSQNELLNKYFQDELNMLCRLDQLSGDLDSLEGSNRHCLFFRAPVNGNITLVSKHDRLLMVFFPMDANNPPFKIGSQNQNICNSILITFPDFSDDLIRVIIIEALTNVLLRIRRPNDFRLNRDSLFSQEDITSITDITSNAEKRIAASHICARKMGQENFREILNLPISNLLIPMIMGEVIPIYSFLEIGQLQSLRLSIGFCEIPPNNIGSYDFVGGWTWFSPAMIFNRVSFEHSLNINNLPQINSDSPIIAWYGIHQENPDFLISKISSQDFVFFNPIQSSDIRTSMHRVPFLFSGRANEIHLTARNPGVWEKRTVRVNSRRQLAVINPFESIDSDSPATDISVQITDTNGILQIRVSSEANSSNILISKLSDNEEFMHLFGPWKDDNKFSNGQYINAWFLEHTNKDYIDWFRDSARNQPYNGMNYFTGEHSRNFPNPNDDEDVKRRFVAIFNNISLIIGDEGRTGTHINIFQFLTIATIILNEKSSMIPGPEQGRIGSYFFISIPGTKRSYNGGSNLKAGDLFYNDNFYHHHIDSNPSVRTSSRVSWNGEDSYPSSLDPYYGNENIASLNIGYLDDVTKIIAQADFCKFRGRGLNQITFRSAYLKQIKSLLEKENWINESINEIRTRWIGYIDGNNENLTDTQLNLIADRSTNEEWDTLFLGIGREGNPFNVANVDFEFVCRTIYVFQHAPSKDDFLVSIDDNLSIHYLLGQGRGSIWFAGRKQGSSNSYANLVRNRVKQQMKALLNDYLRLH